MQPAADSVCLNMQPYDGKAVHGGPAPPYAYQPPRAAYPPIEPPRDFVLWSLFNFVFLNSCCLGFAALVFSIKSRDRKVVGDMDGAASYGKTAKCLNITDLILSILFIILLIILVATGVLSMQEHIKRLSNEQPTYNSGWN
ncbi:dispanin subfamily A member 2b-like [Hemicordylus capensis]|uniref:dispanin subfamily A member 2b-like n=1 Tax=Hemicordylus capensis TaxID=884348 RepID=UPI002302E608|nr:dispanin subfamily A member 2b-like [Hemicordylus capensis]